VEVVIDGSCPDSIPVSTCSLNYCTFSTVSLGVGLDLKLGDHPFKARRSHDRANHIFDRNSSAVRELFKPCKDAESCSFDLKNLGSFEFKFFLGDVTKWIGLGIFGPGHRP